MEASSSSSSPPDSEEQQRSWLDLPRDVVSAIFVKVGICEVLRNVQFVCSLWRNISKDPLIWRTIDMHNFAALHDIDPNLRVIFRRAVDRSSGHLTEISIDGFATDDLLNYIADSTGQLRRLCLILCFRITDEGMCEAAKKLPLLEELEISISSLSKEPLEAIGRCCPNLKSLKFNIGRCRLRHIGSDEYALAIAENMPALHHLQLFGNKLTNDGLIAILNGCPNLVSLDLRRCFNVNLKGSLWRRCSEHITDIRLPCDPIDVYPFEGENDYVSFDEDYPSEISDIELLSDNDYDDYEFSYGSDFSGYDIEDYYYTNLKKVQLK